MTLETNAAASPPRLVRVVNAMGEAKAKVGTTKTLNPDAIVRSACRRTRLEDFGGDEWRTPFEVLIDSYEREAGLTPFGRTLLRQGAVRNLADRLRIVQAMKDNKEITGERVVRPVFVIGLPRTGTSVLLNLLAQAAGSRPLLGWEAAQPMPVRRLRRAGPDPRIRRYGWAVRGFKYLAPHFETLHPLPVNGPEEDLALIQRTYQSWGYLAGASVPSYERWLWDRSTAEVELGYRFYLSQLQFLQWQRPGAYWLLKSPAHLNTLEGLLGVFPDACVVQTHRDMAKVFPSSCSLFEMGRSFSARPEPRSLGRELLRSTIATLDHLLDARSRISPDRVFDVRFDELMSDPAGVVRSVHSHFDLPVPPDLGDRTTAYLADNRRYKHGVHRYSLDRFGIAPEELDEVAHRYHERFAIPREG